MPGQQDSCSTTVELPENISQNLLPRNKFLLILTLQCPSYFIALDILEKDCGHKPVSVPMSPDGSGVDVAELEEAGAQFNGKKFCMAQMRLHFHSMRHINVKCLFWNFFLYSWGILSKR